MQFTIRSLAVEELYALKEIDASFVADSVIELERKGNGIESTWRLIERRGSSPSVGGRRYDLTETDLEDMRRHMQTGQGIWLVAESLVDGHKPLGVIDVRYEAWNNTCVLWLLAVDSAYRRRGIGRVLFARAVEYGQSCGARAILIETQTNNVPACHFYHAMGCELVGLHEMWYSNHDTTWGELALFWAYRLNDGARGAD